MTAEIRSIEVLPEIKKYPARLCMECGCLVEGGADADCPNCGDDKIAWNGHED